MKRKRLTPLSHRDFKRGIVVATENPRIVAVRMQAEQLSNRIKKDGISG